jgi:AAA15 family ATPase/GTPase
LPHDDDEPITVELSEAILEGIQIGNHRALHNVALGKLSSRGNRPLPKLIEIIGASEPGKSTLLDALGFLGDCLAGLE